MKNDLAAFGGRAYRLRVSNIVLVKGKLSIKVFQIGIIAGRQIVQYRDLAVTNALLNGSFIITYLLYNGAGATDNCQID
jgi:hypothetical protein